MIITLKFGVDLKFKVFSSTKNLNRFAICESSIHSMRNRQNDGVLASINFVQCERKITPSRRHGACRAVNEKETERVISWWLTIG